MKAALLLTLALGAAPFAAAQAQSAATAPQSANRFAASIKPADFQFRDLRAKAATEADDDRGIEQAQALMGHSTPAMTRRYIRHRAGKLVKPSK